jgi:hypothetical protein
MDQVPIASHRTLLKLAEGILKFARTDKCLVKPGSWLVERLITGLELDGHELRDGKVVVREANVFDVEEQSGALHPSSRPWDWKASSSHQTI